MSFPKRAGARVGWMNSCVGRFGRLCLILPPITVGLSACQEGVLSPQGPIGKAERVILIDATVIMLAVVIPVILLTAAFAWWFRAGNGRARYLPDWDYSGRIEMIVWSIPALVVTFLGGIAWIGSHQLDPPAPIVSAQKQVEVEVVSLDWKWLFIYPSEGIASVNRLVVPIGTPVHFKLTSTTVMNSFFVPQLGSQIYTMPNMTTQLNLQADTAGVYKGLSAQFSGDGFSDMQFELAAVTDDQYRDWIKTAQANGNSLNADTFSALARPSSANRPETFASVEPRLFQTVSTGGLSDLSTQLEHPDVR
jgi:cytochrome o ubiquinol oxidase subunit II